MWDYDVDAATFQAILAGDVRLGTLDQNWAALRLLEYAPYGEIVRLIGYKRLVTNWPRWRDRIRAQNRQCGFDFLVNWLPTYHPELL